MLLWTTVLYFWEFPLDTSCAGLSAGPILISTIPEFLDFPETPEIFPGIIKPEGFQPCIAMFHLDELLTKA